MLGREVVGFRLPVSVAAAALCVGAAVLIGIVLGSSASSKTMARVASSGLVFGVFSPFAAAGVLLTIRRPRLAWFGCITVLLGLFAFLAIVVRLLEGEIFLFSGDWELQAIAVAAMLTAAQISLLLAYDGPENPLAVRVISCATVALVFGIGCLLGYAATGHGDTVSDKAYAVLFALYLLGAALLVLFHGADWVDRNRHVSAPPIPPTPTA